MSSEESSKWWAYALGAAAIGGIVVYFLANEPTYDPKLLKEAVEKIKALGEPTRHSDGRFLRSYKTQLYNIILHASTKSFMAEKAMLIGQMAKAKNIRREDEWGFQYKAEDRGNKMIEINDEIREKEDEIFTDLL